MIWTSALSSQWNAAVWFSNLILKICRATITGKHFRKYVPFLLKLNDKPIFYTVQCLIGCISIHINWNWRLGFWTNKHCLPMKLRMLTAPWYLQLFHHETSLFFYNCGVNQPPHKWPPGMITHGANCRHALIFCIFSRLAFLCFVKSENFSQ